ncbi:GIY-YIG nuclease family protein [Mesorhizobium sp. B3-1-3]|nr:GIY-YIG nuclease family protein [Mesorhizobium sp. B3-1-8]TPI75634.1 GIY-YIG nuclease family protein [Mesorhizobium sp. B3-1-3]
MLASTTSSAALSQATPSWERTGQRHTKAPLNAPGHVYIAVNAAWPGRCKVGLAKDLKNRLRQMNTNDPERGYRFHETREFDDRKQAEAILHELLAGYRIAGTEWFDLHPDDAAGLLRGLHRRTAQMGRPEGDAGDPD